MYFYMVKISSIFFVASECWTLSRFLPLLIGDLVPEDDNHWQLFLLLLKIVNFVMSPRSTHDIAAYTRDLIAEHHTSFKQLYPDRPLTPKMHYMVHIPEWIIK